MTDTIIGAFIGVGGAIIGAIIAGPIAYFFSSKLVSKTHNNTIDLMQRQEFNKAAVIFRAAFLPEIIFLKHNAKVTGTVSTDNLNEFLFAGYAHRHLKAFEVFRRYLTSEERAGIDKAWQNYCHYDIEGENEHFFAMYAGDKWEEKDTKILALERIEEILKFAKHK